MKKLGLIGGMGPESTIPYYHDIVYGVQETLGESVFPELTIESVNVFKVLGLCGEQKYDELTAYLMEAIDNLAKRAHMLRRQARKAPPKPPSIFYTISSSLSFRIRKDNKRIAIFVSCSI